MPLKLRDPKIDPAAGDELFYKHWRVEVLGRERGAVQYRKSKDGAAGQGEQSIDEWRAWTPAAKVKLRGESDCVLSAFASGPCAGCRKQMSGPVHITPEGVKCDDCCKSRTHAKRREVPVAI
jgi:hypothetical protein